MDNNCNNTKTNAQNCGKNNKPTNVKQDNKNKVGNAAQNCKNSTYRSDKLFNDTATGGNRPSRNNRRDDDGEF